MSRLAYPADREQRTQALQTRLARRIAAALSEGLTAQPQQDIDERLRVAREQAIARARAGAHLQTAPAGAVLAGGGTAALTGGLANDTPWWLRLSSLLPLAVLVAGLFLIDRHYTQSQIEAAAEVDAALLADDLPPEAYRDPGFAQFLKTARP